MDISTWYFGTSSFSFCSPGSHDPVAYFGQIIGVIASFLTHGRGFDNSTAWWDVVRPDAGCRRALEGPRATFWARLLLWRWVESWEATGKLIYDEIKSLACFVCLTQGLGAEASGRTEWILFCKDLTSIWGSPVRTGYAATVNAKTNTNENRVWVRLSMLLGGMICNGLGRFDRFEMFSWGAIIKRGQFEVCSGLDVGVFFRIEMLQIYNITSWRAARIGMLPTAKC